MPEQPTGRSIEQEAEAVTDGLETIEEAGNKPRSTSSNDRDDHVKAPSSILIVGATGLVGLRFIKYIKRIATEEQTIYVLTRRRLFREHPGVIVKIAEAATWPAEILQIPNLTTVLSALTYRANSVHDGNPLAPLDDKFYLVHHNLNHQIAIAAKEAGASTFVFASHYDVGYPVPRLLLRRTKMRNATEKDIMALNFDRLIIFRSGPLAAVKEKTGSLKGISFSSAINSLITVALEPFYFINTTTPFKTFNFASSVAKAAAMRMNDETTSEVEIYNSWWIVYGAIEYNLLAANLLLEKANEIFANYEKQGVHDEFKYLSIELNSLQFGSWFSS